MKKRIILTIFALLAVLILTTIPNALCAKFYKINWNPEASQAIVNLDYPSEAHRGDIITYEIYL